MTEWNQSSRGSTLTPDEIITKIRQQFKRFKGGPVLILAAVVVVVLFWSTWFTVQPEETGIVQRFGKVMRTAGPGLHFKLPFGVEKVRLLPTARVLKEEFGFRTVSTAPGEKTRYDTRGTYKDESLMLTGDLNVIDVQWIVQYRIEDPIRYLFKLRDTPKTIRDTSEAVMRRAVGNRLGSDVLTTGRVAVAGEAKAEIQKILTAYESGVRVLNLDDPVGREWADEFTGRVLTYGAATEAGVRLLESAADLAGCRPTSPACVWSPWNFRM